MGLSYNSVYEILKSHIRDYQISKDYVNEVKFIVESVIRDIAKASIDSLQSENELRAINNFKPIKRIHIESLLSVYDNTGLAFEDSSNSETQMSIGRSQT